ncbi:MAG: DUF3141 domain-containing protein [Hyphomicrobiales bacterium]|nr:DUF3141 domain-containing protein [Hyphomicrobiales bacterium]
MISGPVFGINERLNTLSESSVVLSEQSQVLTDTLSKHLGRIAETHGPRLRNAAKTMTEIAGDVTDETNRTDLNSALIAYAVDAWQRAVLTLDTLRERGNIYHEHAAQGHPPVLIYDYEVVIDGKDLKRPTNYMLLRILPPKGTTVYDWKRPYMIIDPRAGHGPGIGGFKMDSQVGVALRDGHPVYFVAFHPEPEPGQTIADVTRSEAAFVKEIAKRHPEAPKPIVVGNCQGGWATLLLAATNPDLTGPVVLNGAPVATWSGTVGSNPMRYNGGLLGGALPALFMSDLGNGVFDGANLVMNFEHLNPGRTQFRKYYDLYADVDKGRERFLEFEKWWSGFYLMNEAEIRWIVEQLFVGNRLARGEARLERGRQVDPKQIRSPIIVFASHGDNITPPQQALNWIVDTYADESEIKIRGQRIIYMVHEQVGHLGIFVSSSIAKKEHAEMASTMKTIEALAPGLYEMVLEDVIGEGLDTRFVVSFQERTMADILELDDSREDERAFAAVARLSELGAEFYDLFVRPVVQGAVTPQSAEMLRQFHPMRMQRSLLSDQNPGMRLLPVLAEQIAGDRRAINGANPFLRTEQLTATLIEQSLDFWRDMRDAWYEMAFQGIYSSPLMTWLGRTHAFQRTRKDADELRHLPEAQLALMNITKGGFEEAVIRMLLVLAEARGSVRRSRLERSAHVLTHDEPFKSLGAELRAKLIHEQKIIVQFEHDKAVETLPGLLDDMEEREKAVGVVEYIAGPLDEMEPHTIHALQTFRKMLGLPELTAKTVKYDPLAEATSPKGSDGLALVKPKLFTAPQGVADNLTCLRGLGEKLSEKMNRTGIYHLSQIASWTLEEAAWVDRELKLNGRIAREGWIEQAKARVAETADAAE